MNITAGLVKSKLKFPNKYKCVFTLSIIDKKESKYDFFLPLLEIDSTSLEKIRKELHRDVDMLINSVKERS